MSNDMSGNKELRALYEMWLEQVKKAVPEVFTEKNYSNPYYIGIPKGWYSSDVRILIVGEQGFGYEGNGKEEGIPADSFQQLQERNVKQFYAEVSNKYEDQHPFWDRARKVSDLGYPCTWTFIDKICWRRDRRSKLSDGIRNKLHSVEIRVLEEEIKILQPTHVFFFGWHGVSIKHELPEISKKLYPNGTWDDSIWENYYCFEEQDGIKFLFSYSPHSPYWKDKPVDYEERLMEDFTKSVGGKNNNSQVRNAQKQQYQKDEKAERLNEIKELWDVRGMRKTIKALLIVWLIASIILLIFMPVAGIIGLVLMPILALLQWLGYRGRVNNYLKHPELITQQKELQTQQTHQTQIARNQRKQVSNTSGTGMTKGQKAAVDAAASYAIGKTVQNAARNTRTYQNLARNPYTQKNKQPATQQTNRYSASANKVYSAEYRFTECATCQFWEGNRKASGNNDFSGKKTHSVCESPKATGRCSKRSMKTEANSNHTCRHYVRWNELKQ